MLRWAIVAGIVAGCGNDASDLGHSVSEHDGGFGRNCVIGTTGCGEWQCWSRVDIARCLLPH